MLKVYEDGRLFGEQDGDEPLHVLALHGWARDRRDFAGLLEPFGGVRLDLPGFGASPVPPEAPTPARVAEMLMPMVSSLGSPRVVLGHSYGGRVALHLGARLNDLQHIVLVGTPVVRPAPGRPSLRYRAWRRAHALGLVPDIALERVRERYGSADYRAAHGVMRDALVAAVNEDYTDLLPRISCPVTLITGEHDTAAPPASQQQAAATIPHAEVVVLPGEGHLVGPAHLSAIRETLTKVLT
jgi:pimeloyl-ACP methyl ester carboxylesterase